MDIHEKIKEFIVSIGMAAIQNRITDKILESQMREKLCGFIQHQRSLNKQVPMAEEIDLGGLEEYLTSDFIDDVRIRLFGNKQERAIANKRIIEATSRYASANTSLSQKRAKKIVSESFDILRNFYRKKINRDLLFTTNEIKDVVQEEHKQTRELVSKKQDAILALLQDGSVLSVDKSLKQIQEGNISETEKGVSLFFKAIDIGHTLYPDYGFRLREDNHLVSFPLNEDARTKYPEAIKIEPSEIKCGDFVSPTISNEILNYSYRRQLPIFIGIKEAQKFLGDVLDPIQTEAEELRGNEALVMPPEFPPAFPCYVTIDEKIVIPYLLLRAKEILDDESIVLTNEEQNDYPYHIRICILNQPNQVTFSIKPHTVTNRELLSFNLLLKELISGNIVSIYASEKKELLLQVKANSDEKRCFDYLDDTIEWLNKIVTIEDYFETTFSIPNDLSEIECSTIDILYRLILDCYKCYVESIEFTFFIDEETRQQILDLEDRDYNIRYSGLANFVLFEKEYNVPIDRIVECVKVKDLCHLKEKIQVLDIGDQVKLTYVPGSNKTQCVCTDRILTDTITQINMTLTEME